MWLALGAVAIVLVGTGFWLQSRSVSVDGPVPLEPLTLAEVKAVLVRQQVAGARGLDALLEPGAAVTAFAKKATQRAADPVARAEAVTQALRARAKALAFIPWSLGEPRSTAIMTADGVLAAIAKDGARKELYPIEVAALAVAALRSLGVDAMLAELSDLPSERAPVDPAGYFGYFVVSLSSEAAGDSKTRLYDPYAGRNLPADAKVNLVDDATAVGAALAIRGVHEVAYLGDPKLALESSSDALRLASRLPSVRTARGIIVLSGKMVEQGLQELAAAVQMRGDPVRLHNLASARMLSGDMEAATKDLTAALGRAPDFAGAHATLGAVQMQRGEMESGQQELQKAESLAPDLSLIQWGFAELAMRQGDRESGLARGKRALDARPSFDARLRYAVLLRQAAKYEELRKEAHALVDSCPAYRKQEVRDLITAVLGPTALDPTEMDPTADDLSDLGGSDLNLKLGQGSKLLAEPADGKGLKLGGQGGAADPLILLGDPSKLRLRSSSDKLKLKLGE